MRTSVLVAGERHMTRLKFMRSDQAYLSAPTARVPALEVALVPDDSTASISAQFPACSPVGKSASSTFPDWSTCTIRRSRRAPSGLKRLSSRRRGERKSRSYMQQQPFEDYTEVCQAYVKVAEYS